MLFNGFSVKKIILQVAHIIGMSVKLSHARRWLSVRNYLGENYGIQVNFSLLQCVKYTNVNEDPEYVKSPQSSGPCKFVPATNVSSKLTRIVL